MLSLTLMLTFLYIYDFSQVERIQGCSGKKDNLFLAFVIN